MSKSYRVIMIDYCYCNYKNYLKNVIIYELYDEIMSILIVEKLRDLNYYILCSDNFIVKNR